MTRIPEDLESRHHGEQLMKPNAITRFDRDVCRMVAQVAERAVREALAPYGLNVRVHGGSFGDGFYAMKIEAAVVQAGGLVLDRDADAFLKLANLYGFEAADLGRTFEDVGHTWKVAGLKPKSDRFPVLVEREDGKRFKYPADRVLRGLGRAVPAA